MIWKPREGRTAGVPRIFLTWKPQERQNCNYAQAQHLELFQLTRCVDLQEALAHLGKCAAVTCQ